MTAQHMNSDDFSFQIMVPTRFLFGAGQLGHLHEQPLPGKKALLVISNGKSARASGALARTEAQLRQAGADVVLFDNIQPNPRKETCEEAGALARAEGCDFIVGLGGGSVLDASKAIAALAANGGDLWDYMAAGTGKGLPFARKPLPLVAITTTAGTGSEADGAAVITKLETHEKQGLVHPDLFPVLSIIDPELMLGVPPSYTAFQGFDALFHSMEGYLSAKANLLSETIEERAIRTIATSLPRACCNGSDLEARTRMAYANTLSGLSMVASSCTAEHAIEHALSAYHENLPHGAGLILISLAYYRTILAKGACNDRLIRMARWLGRNDAATPEELPAALADLQAACGVDTLRMSDYGISPDEFDAMAENALTVMGKLFRFERVPLTHADIVAILQASWR